MGRIRTTTRIFELSFSPILRNSDLFVLRSRKIGLPWEAFGARCGIEKIICAAIGALFEIVRSDWRAQSDRLKNAISRNAISDWEPREKTAKIIEQKKVTFFVDNPRLFK